MEEGGGAAAVVVVVVLMNHRLLGFFCFFVSLVFLMIEAGLNPSSFGERKRKITTVVLVGLTKNRGGVRRKEKGGGGLGWELGWTPSFFRVKLRMNEGILPLSHGYKLTQFFFCFF